MKLALIAVLGVGIVLLLSSYVFSNETLVENIKPTVVEVEKEVHPDWSTDADAVEAAKAVIRKKEVEARLEVLNNEIEERQTEKTDLEKELGTYWKERDNVKALIRATFPEDPHTAVAIANCESGLKPNAYNPTNNNGSTDGGLWQINSVHDSTLDELGLDKYNPEDATRFARMLYEKNGWYDWVCYTKNLLVMR